MAKKIIAVIAIVAGAIMTISGLAPMMIGAILEAQASTAVGIIGGADGPTAVFVTGVIGTGNVILEIMIGILLIVAGIIAYRRSKK